MRLPLGLCLCTDFGERPGDLATEFGKRGIEGATAGDEDIVVTVANWKGLIGAHCLFQATAHARPFDCIAGPGRQGEAEAGLSGLGAADRLQRERRGVNAQTLGGSEKFGSSAEPAVLLCLARHSGGQALPAARPPRRDNLAAARGRHASTEAVPALAHKLAGLIGPFHNLLR